MRTSWLMALCFPVLLHCPTALRAAETEATTTTPVQAAAPTDPGPRKVINDMLEKYRSLNSFSCEIELKVERTGQPALTRQISVAYQKPRKISVIAKNAGKIETRNVSNGSQFFIYRPIAAKDKYWKEPVKTTGVGEETLVPSLQRTGIMSTTVLLGVDPFAEMWKSSPQTITLGQPQTVADDVVNVVTASSTFGEGQTITQTVYIGQDDSLLRRFVITDGKSIIMTETYSGIKTNPDIPAATFVFTPPKGAVEQEMDVYWDKRLKKGAAPFAFKATDIKGKPISLDQYKGKVVLLDFWASWCGPCTAEMPNVKAAYDKYKSRGFDVIGISLDEDRKAMDAYLKKNGMSWRQVFDGKGWESKIAQQYGVRAIPFALLIGRDGKIVAMQEDTRESELHESIERALTKK